MKKSNHAGPITRKRVVLIVLDVLAVLAILAAIFVVGRLGWRLFGFAACDTDVTVDRAEIVNGYAIIEGRVDSGRFLGEMTQEKNGFLHVGIKSGKWLGVLPGDPTAFSLSIPVSDETSQIWLKAGGSERLLYQYQSYLAEDQGIYLCIQDGGIGRLELAYGNEKMEIDAADLTPGIFTKWRSDLAETAVREGRDMPFTVNVFDMSGNQIWSEDCVFGANCGRMELTVRPDGTINQVERMR